MKSFNVLITSSLLAFMCLAAPNLADCKPSEKSFSIAVIPDTQNYIDFAHQKDSGFPFDARDMFFAQMAYIRDNLKSQGGDIAFVDSLGDVWQHWNLNIDPEHEKRGFKWVPNPLAATGGPTEKVKTVEMPTAKKGFAMIAGKTPFSVVPGNHDYDAMWNDSNHPPAAKFVDTSSLGIFHSSGLNNFREVFGANTPFFKGKKWYVASHDGGADSAQIFSAGGYKFLHIGLQFEAPDASLKWAQSVIKAHPGLPTIITTHDYLNNDGERLPSPIVNNNAADPNDNTPQMTWDKFISRNDQIFLVLCGHESGQAFRVDNNKFGHKVWQVLSDYQNRMQTALDAGIKPSGGFGIGDGWMRLMIFDMKGKTPKVHVETYSTYYKKQSIDMPQYAQFYKTHEKPKLSDDEFHAQDDFTFDLTGFKERFGKGK